MAAPTTEGGNIISDLPVRTRKDFASNQEVR